MILHNYRTYRNYQFPNAVATIPDKQRKGNVGYVVNVQYQKELYGVVKYVVDGDRVAWLESPIHFKDDKERATKWVMETLQGIATGSLPKDDNSYWFKSLNNSGQIRQLELDLVNNALIVHGYDFEQTLHFSTLDELKQHLNIVDRDGYKPEDMGDM